MTNRQIRTLLTIVSGILLLLGSSSISHSQAPSAPTFAGAWNTVTSTGKKIPMTLDTVRRAEVTGIYAINGLTGSYEPFDSSDNVFVKVSATTANPILQTLSSIRGRVTDNVLRFKWLEEGAHGAGRFTLSADGQSFEGTFSLTDNPDDTSGGTWNGMRAPNFTGVWQTKSGDKLQFPQVLLQQAGNRVTGQLFAGRPEMGVIKDGVIDGNTLRLQIWRPRPVLFNGRLPPDEFMGSGELVMNADGKSFTGTILGGPTSGTLIAR